MSFGVCVLRVCLDGFGAALVLFVSHLGRFGLHFYHFSDFAVPTLPRWFCRPNQTSS
jgi:hypothetical protein